MTKQCPSCGGDCQGKHCERANIVTLAHTKESLTNDERMGDGMIFIIGFTLLVIAAINQGETK